MTPTEGHSIRPEWSKTITRLLGNDGWQEALYKPKPLPPMNDMFGHDNADDQYSRLNVDELTDWVTNRLEVLFSHVARPVRLDNAGRPLFLFYFAVSNPSERTWRIRSLAQLRKKREEFDDFNICTIEHRELKTVISHPGPVRCAVYSVPVQPELCAKKLN